MFSCVLTITHFLSTYLRLKIVFLFSTRREVSFSFLFFSFLQENTAQHSTAASLLYCTVGDIFVVLITLSSLSATDLHFLLSYPSTIPSTTDLTLPPSVLSRGLSIAISMSISSNNVMSRDDSAEKAFHCRGQSVSKQ
jgi:hypothetical protein